MTDPVPPALAHVAAIIIVVCLIAMVIAVTISIIRWLV